MFIDEVFAKIKAERDAKAAKSMLHAAARKYVSESKKLVADKLINLSVFHGVISSKEGKYPNGYYQDD